MSGIGRARIDGDPVRFFASLREQVGCECRSRSSTESRDIATIVGSILERGLGEPVAALAAPTCRVALNQEIIGGDARLRDGDEVAFLPPITGG